MKRTGELCLILLPVTSTEKTYVRVVVSRFNEMFTTPMRCTCTSLPANELGLLFAARVARNLGENKVIIKHVDSTIFANDLPPGIRELEKGMHLVGSPAEFLPKLMMRAKATHRTVKCNLW